MKAHILAGPADADGVRQATGLRLENLPKSGMQKITSDTLERHADFISIEDGEITYHTVDGDVVFKIEREPGRYCLTCGERLPDHGGNGTALELMRTRQCAEHVEQHGAKAVKDDNGAFWTNQPKTFLCSVDDRRQG